ncbi:ATP-grasp domain-containing protein [Psychroserpens sp.]|uniref:ATP-grasp domain-containing protein n=1 Tax=Psychroserpens sp. TaxID=2020870 RepID=UPI00385B522C
MGSKCHVLIPDGNSTWALSVISCLSQNSDYKIFVLSDKKRTAAKYSKHTSYYKYYKKTSDKSWLDVVAKEIQDQNISIIVPIAEEEFRFWIHNQQFLSNAVKVIPLPQIDSFETAINKHELSHFLNKQNFPHPKYQRFENFDSYSRETLELHFPILIKPLQEKGGDGIVKFNDQQALDVYFSKHSQTSELFFQEYIEGYDIDCSVLCSEGEILKYTIQKGKLEGDNAFAPQLCFDFLKNDTLLNVVSEFMKAMQWSGVAHIDLRYDEKTNDFKIIEVNARFWGSVEGSKFAGINFPDLAIQLALNDAIENQEYIETEYMRLKGVFKTIKRQPSFMFKKNYLLNHSETKSFINDPIPTLYRFKQWLIRRL